MTNKCIYCNKEIKGLINTCDCLNNKELIKLWNENNPRKFDHIKLKDTKPKKVFKT